ncbi:hypothetical protein OAO99_01215 [Candidatus Pelagibacter sp.]|nr:hypothetical protein [Candidatus Pelagibacter sp.]
MKRLLLILILTFSIQSWTKADDLSDIEIEGISIGDSLLDFVTESQIMERAFYPYNNNKFYQSGMLSNSFETYEYLQFNLKKDDSEYIIYGISGKIFFENDIKSCLKKKDIVFNEILNLFNKDDIETSSHNIPHDYDKTGESLIYANDIDMSSGGTIRVYCTDWSNKLSEYLDNLKVTIGTEELVDFFNNEAYQ